MYDALIPPFQLMAGNIIVYGVLPFAIALGIGLIWLGLVRQRFSAVFAVSRSQRSPRSSGSRFAKAR